MVDFFDNYDEIEFLESEIEDDDPDAPVGSLFDVVEGKVCPVAQKTQPAPAETVVEEPAPEPVAEVAVEEPAPAVRNNPQRNPLRPYKLRPSPLPRTTHRRTVRSSR